MAYTESGASVPVCQMISGKHDHAKYRNVAKKVERKVNTPREVIIDDPDGGQWYKPLLNLILLMSI